jgi:hypothetical protein
MASGQEHLTGLRWFIHDTIETAREAVRLYFAPLVWIRDFVRGMAVLADQGKEESTICDDLKSHAIIVSDEEFESLITANRRTEQTLRDLVAESDVEQLKHRLAEPLRNLQRERDALIRMQDQFRRLQTLRITDLLHQQVSDSSVGSISPPARKLQPNED